MSACGIYGRSRDVRRYRRLSPFAPREGREHISLVPHICADGGASSSGGRLCGIRYSAIQRPGNHTTLSILVAQVPRALASRDVREGLGTLSA